MRHPSSVQLQMLRELKADQPSVRASAALGLRGLRPWHDADLLRLAGVTDHGAVAQTLMEQGLIQTLVVSPTRTARLESRLATEWSERICRRLEAMHAAEPLQSFVDRSRLLSYFAYVDDPALLDAILAWMQANGAVRLAEGRVALTNHEPLLSSRQQELFAEIERRFAAAGCQPPSVADCYDLHPRQPKEIDKLVRLAESDGRLVHLAQGIYLHRDALEEVHATLGQVLGEGGEMTLSEIRELLGTTRKYAVPLCEYLDRTGFTKRRGDVRVLA